jgi:FdhD protein
MNAMTEAERAAFSRVVVRRWHDGLGDERADTVAEEVPVALEYNGISHAVMLASPLDLEDFALGFSLSEGILLRASELFDCEVSEMEEGIRVAMQISSERFISLKEKRRNLTGRTGCGLCGAETLQQAIRKPKRVTGTAIFSAAALHAGLETMQVQQTLQRHTGATHAAAWLDSHGVITTVREDVGRHNALDKLIGALARKKEDFSSGAVLVTSRASYEMVQKAATLGISLLAAVSAPTGLAIRLAEETNVTLVGFARRQGHVVYANQHRLLHDSGLGEID